MISQEILYQYLYNEQWKEILDILYEERDQIKNDALLTFAAKTFETEFLKTIINYDVARVDIIENLETLYLLHRGKFHKLSDDNYKALVLEIVKRNSIEKALPYAQLFPKEDISLKVIEENKKREVYKLKEPQKMTINWIEIYNRIFELINNQGDPATYFSGPRFIDTIKLFEPYFPDYNQFINQRNLQGKSTSRKIFYYDILFGLNEEKRKKVINRILEILTPFEREKVIQIEALLGNKTIQKVEPSKVLSENGPTVFISYSWDSEDHKKWVLDLADKLCGDGINVILDRYYLKPGTNLPHFIEDNISKSDRVIIVFTKNYKLKADKRTGGVGYEYSIMNVELYKNQTSNEKIIPILRDGTTEESIPTFMQQFIHIDTRNNENFENSYKDLIREIYNEPEIKRPEIGRKPIF